MLKFIITVVVSMLFTGCVSVKIPEDLPENTHLNIEVNVGGYKSAAGHGNLLEVTTDAEATIPLMGVAEDAE